VRGVDLVTSIKPVKSPAIVVSRLSGLVADARRRADVVLIDSSPLLATSDALDVLQYADAALVTCRVGRTKYGEATRARRILQRADVPLLGVVLTGTAPHRGTPYGQPSRKEVVLSQIANWARNPGPDGHQTKTDHLTAAGEPAYTVSSVERPDYQRDGKMTPEPAATAEAGPEPVAEPDSPAPTVPVPADWDETIEIRPPTHRDAAAATGSRRHRPSQFPRSS
jgi:hypothetical protein